MQNDVVVLTVTCPRLIFRLSLVVGACPAISQKVTGLVLTFPLSWHFCCFLQWPRMSLVLNVLFCCCFALFSWLFLLVAWFLLVFLSVSSNCKQNENVYMPSVRRGSCLLRRRNKCSYWNCKFQRSSCGKERGQRGGCCWLEPLPRPLISPKSNHQLVRSKFSNTRRLIG